jgi:lantibiotic biosynthesis protein
MTAASLTTRPGAATVRAAAEGVIDAFAALTAKPDAAGDIGPVVLAAALATGRAGPVPADDTPLGRALVVWLQQLRSPAHPGLLGGGTAGRLLGLRIAATSWPRLGHLAAAVRTRLRTYVAASPWASTDVGWPDYDLVTGPAGILLAFAADPAVDASGTAPLVAHLARLCAENDLRGLRVGQYRDDELRGWNHGRINMGLAHGVPGVAAALCASGYAGTPMEVIERPLRRLTSRMVAESYADARGVVSWAVGSPGPRPAPQHACRRQAWCYGCPGNAWTLWEAGRLLGEPDLQAFASQAAVSFISAYDDDFYVDGLDICHGAAGLLAVLDAFTRHTPVPGAAALRDHLAGFLTDRLDAIAELASRDCSLQSGASGVIMALFAADGGDRRWLAALGLR